VHTIGLYRRAGADSSRRAYDFRMIRQAHTRADTPAAQRARALAGTVALKTEGAALPQEGSAHPQAVYKGWQAHGSHHGHPGITGIRNTIRNDPVDQRSASLLRAPQIAKPLISAPSMT
jgi:hypothetical protein